MKKLIHCVCVLIFVSIFSVMLHGKHLYYGMTLSVEKFSELRTAIETSNEARFSEIIQKLPNPTYIPRNLDEGHRFLELIDSYYLLDFSDRIEDGAASVHAVYDSLPENVKSLSVGFSFQGFSVRVYAENENDYHINEDSEVAFSLETSEGEEIAFYRNVSSDYTASVKNNATELIITIDVYDDSIDEATLLSLLGEDPINYCTVRALTSDYEDDLSDVVFVDKPDVARLLLWIALPVGVAVIGGAAVILLRRKKKKAVTATE
jgi:hypothetical protein